MGYLIPACWVQGGAGEGWVGYLYLPAGCVQGGAGEGWVGYLYLPAGCRVEQVRGG